MQNRQQRGEGATGTLVALLFCAGIFLATALLWTGFRLRDAVQTAPEESQPPAAVTAYDLPGVGEGLTTVEIVDKLMPSVVSVHIYEGRVLRVTGSGSGIVLSGDGYIVTNAHVVEGARSLEVELHDGTVYSARLVGENTRVDIAVLKIEAHDLTPAEFGDSDLVVVGQRAVAMGNAAGMLPGTPTLGIISGVGREIPVEGSDGRVTTQTLLQTDAAINPGNSGGALANAWGQVVGVNVAKFHSSDIDNIGFAIPTNVVLPVVEEIMEGE